MKIVVDARWIGREMSGIAMYTQELLAQYAVMEGADRCVALFDDPEVRRRVCAETGLCAAAACTAIDLPYGVFSARSQLALPGLLTRLRADVYHAPNYMLPLFPRAAAWGRPRRTAYVATIHDLIPLVVPNHAPRSRKSRALPVFRWVLRRAAAAADVIVTVSEVSRRDILSRLQSQHRPLRVSVVHNGVSADFAPAPGGPPQRIGQDPRRLLYVGRADPYKNVDVLLRALATLRRTCPFPVELVVAGPRDARYPETERLAQALGVAAAVTWAGHLTRSQLVDAYRGADVLVHASRYEGFGLQVVEAMAAGLPVVAGAGGAVPEVAGDAAILLPPDDAEAFAREIRRVLSDPALAADLRRRGLARAAQFSWRTAASQTLAVYREALAAINS